MTKVISKSARKFSKALFASCHHDTLANIADVLEAIANVLESDTGVASFFVNPGIVSENKKQVLNALTTELKSPSELNNFLQILLEADKITLLPEIAKEFRSLHNHFLKSLELSITTAQNLSAEEKQEVLSYLQKNFGSTVQVDWQSNPEIIGGFIVKSGDQLLDSSVSGALEKIKLSLLS